MVNGGDFRPKLDGRGMNFSSKGSGWGRGGSSLTPAEAREVEAASPSPLPTEGVSLPLSPCSREGMEVGGDTRGSLTFTLTMLLTLGASLPSPDPSEGGGRGREGGRGDTDLVEVGDKGGLEAVSIGSPAWREDVLLGSA